MAGFRDAFLTAALETTESVFHCLVVFPCSPVKDAGRPALLDVLGFGYLIVKDPRGVRNAQLAQRDSEVSLDAKDLVASR